jgi:hypothetical protein
MHACCFVDSSTRLQQFFFFETMIVLLSFLVLSYVGNSIAQYTVSGRVIQVEQPSSGVAILRGNGGASKQNPLASGHFEL